MTRYQVPKRSMLISAAVVAVSSLLWMVGTASDSARHSSPEGDGSRSSWSSADPASLSGEGSGPILLAQATTKAPDRAKQIKALLSEAEDLADAGQFTKAYEKIAQARSLDPKDPRVADAEKGIRKQEADLKAKASQLKLNVDEFSSCLTSGSSWSLATQIAAGETSTWSPGTCDPLTGTVVRLAVPVEETSGATGRLIGETSVMANCSLD